MFDDLIPETSLADVHLSEMPGLHNTGYYFLSKNFFYEIKFQIN